MSSHNDATLGRREVLKTSAAMLGGALVGSDAGAAAEVKNVNTNSSPSTLKITDLRVATVVKPGPSPCTIVRIDTNQGVYGLGEVRDGASATYALMLKSRILGENPLRIDFLFPLSKFKFYACALSVFHKVPNDVEHWFFHSHCDYSKNQLKNPKDRKHCDLDPQMRIC